ncbi:MAG TPA: GNAT family N-acetyltransferase [Burkholderiaceae bacterium]
MLAAAEDRARAAGCSHVELSSNERRTRAHAFYEREGFAEVRRRFVKRF